MRNWPSHQPIRSIIAYACVSRTSNTTTVAGPFPTNMRGNVDTTITPKQGRWYTTTTTVN